MEQKLVFRVSAEFQELKNAFSGIKDDFSSVGDEVKKVEDKFTKSWTKMESNMKIFGTTAENVKGKMNTLKTSMVDLVSQGINPTDARIVKMKADYDALGVSMNNTEGINKSNQAYTHLALVLQDLPFGFRGIQNNLPALIGDLAGMSGIFYLLGSAVIAFFTAYDMGAFGAKKSTDEWADSVKNANKELHDTINYSNTTTQTLGGLVSIGKDYTLSEKVRLGAFKEIKDELSKVNKLESDKIKNMSDASSAVDLYTEAIKAQQLAEVAGKRLAELQIQQLKDRAILEAQSGKGIHPLEWFGLTESDATAASKRLTQTIGEIRLYEQIQQTALKSNLNNPYSSFNKSKDTDKKSVEQAQRVAEDIAKNNADSKKRELELYKEDAWKKYEVSVQFAEAEKKLDLLKLSNSEYTAQQKSQLELGIYKKYSDELLKLDQDLQTQLLENDKKKKEKKKKDDKKAFDEEKKVGEKNVRDIETQLGVQTKLNKGNLIQQQEDIKAAMAKTAVLAASTFGTGAFKEYIDLYDKLQAKLDGMNIAALRGADAMKKVNNIIQDMAVNSVVLLSENIGKALGGETVDLFGGFIELMGSGLEEIGKALIAYGLAMDAFKKAFSNPYAAVAAGVALVIAGSLLKATISKTSGGGSSGGQQGNIPAFANGGIISGPTYGLMGEYPGASSNPEVVAPLDKLKDMIGGGRSQGGTFVLRGQDLLLAVNRAQKASNIKGQTISLA